LAILRDASVDSDEDEEVNRGIAYLDAEDKDAGDLDVEAGSITAADDDDDDDDEAGVCEDEV
jgi:hypothetical protein